jgi:cytochrome c-type biogenesis protein CcmH
MGRRRLTSLLLATSLLLSGTAVTAAASPPRLTEIEAEVMCPVCGTLLELAESPQAQRERAFIARLLAAGRTRAQVKDALLAQYGPRVLALPRATGFDLSAYLVPALAFLLAAAALALGVRRWRRNARQDSSKQPVEAAPEGDAAARLDADIARYDL